MPKTTTAAPIEYAHKVIIDSHWFIAFRRVSNGQWLPEGVEILRHWRDELPEGITRESMRTLPAFRIIEGEGRIARSVSFGTSEAGQFKASGFDALVMNPRHVFDYKGGEK